MKKISGSVLLLLFTTAVFGQPRAGAHREHIKQLVVNSFNDIWSGLDSRKMDTYYTKDFLLLENGEVWNNDSIRNYLDNAVLVKPMPVRVNSIEVIKVKVAGQRGWIAYHNHATFSIDGKVVRTAHWLESATAVRTKKGWKLEMLHSSRISNE